MPETPAPAETPVADFVDAGAAETPPPPEPGWYRNRGPVDLVVQPNGYPSTLLGPGEATWLPDNPQHRDIEPCDEPPPAVAADTTGSEK